MLFDHVVHLARFGMLYRLPIFRLLRTCGHWRAGPREQESRQAAGGGGTSEDESPGPHRPGRAVRVWASRQRLIMLGRGRAGFPQPRMPHHLLAPPGERLIVLRTSMSRCHLSFRWAQKIVPGH